MIKAARRRCWQYSRSVATRRSTLSNPPAGFLSRPESTFYLFAEVTDAMRNMGITDVAEFATAALHNTGASFCTRRHFGRPQSNETRDYVRFAYSGINVDDIRRASVDSRAG